MAVVYLHRRNDNNQVFYVGIGKSIKRAYHSRGRNPHWQHIVNKAGYTVEIVAKEVIAKCKELEIMLIAMYGRADLGLGNLVNMTKGGDGVIEKIVTPECRAKMSKAKLGKPAPHNSYKRSQEAKDKLSKAKTKYKVQQFSKDGVLINTFDSVADAVKKLKKIRGIDKTTISRAIKTNRKAGGFVWNYLSK